MTYAALILEAVSEATDVEAERILARDRHREVADARALWCRLLRQRGMSLNRIAATIGRDHSTVAHSLHACDTLLEVDPNFRRIERRAVALINRKEQEQDNESNS